MASPTRIAVVEDEADLREVVVDYLRLQGFAVCACADGAALDAALAAGPVDVVLLDLNLPREGGLSIARRLRALPRPPGIIMVTALGETVDRIVGLEIGADDYIGKPFELREMLARLRSVLRRRVAAPIGQPRVAAPSVAPRPAIPAAPAPLPAPAAPAGRTPDLHFGGFTLSPDRRRLLDPGQEEVPLTTMEVDLLLILATHPGQVLSRERLLVLAHGKDVDPLDRSIDVRITRLRRKLESDPANPRLIRTIRGQGYVFTPDGE
ncbi:response regulator [Roseomonas stagni]|uniref:Regulatory protein VirG n=1 Tax=Falsiroseomonas algicola TaxID=2716930 RepID=A0A6M1LN64_9PROT|nr:response regulator [Falsiroseomonas algicola]NGM21657.1 response regulator [Falsiroseomonas algicola]